MASFLHAGYGSNQAKSKQCGYYGHRTLEAAFQSPEVILWQVRLGPTGSKSQQGPLWEW